MTMIKQASRAIEHMTARERRIQRAKYARRNKMHHIDKLLNELEMLNLADQRQMPPVLSVAINKVIEDSPEVTVLAQAKPASVMEAMDALYEIQDSLIGLLSEKVMHIPELDGDDATVFAARGFNVLATANIRDRGVKRSFPSGSAFPLAPLRSLPYQLGADGRPSAADVDRVNLAKLLDQAKDAVDSPVYQLVEGFPDIQHIKTDVFREQVEYAATIEQDLATARAKKDGANRCDPGRRAAGRRVRPSRGRGAGRSSAFVSRRECLGRHDSRGARVSRAAAPYAAGPGTTRVCP